jgi:hypothetical protein
MYLYKQKRFIRMQNLILLILCFGIKPVFSQSEFTIIGIPDTQYYTENLGGSGSGQGSGNISTFFAQTNWIVNNRIDSNIVYAAHLGDCVQNGDEIEQEWINCSNAMAYLENPATTGLTDGIPFGMAVGNHDMTPWDNHDFNSTDTLFNKYFGISRFSGRNYYSGHYGNNNDNHFDLFQVGILKFIVIYIKYEEYKANPAVLDWANNLLSTYSDRLGIVVSHKLLDDYSGNNVALTSQGQAIFDAVKNNPNLFLMLCGHFTQDGRRVETNGGGKLVYILMSDYQGITNGGDGYFRVMRFKPLRDSIYVYTYSPSLDEYKTDENSQFALYYDFESLLPVQLSEFTGSFSEDKILLKWRTETELNNLGFKIERSTDQINWNEIGFVKGNGNSNSPKNYSFTDNYPQYGMVYYRLKQIDNDGKFEYSDNVVISINTNDKVVLNQNYPNPFNPTTTIEYSLPRNSQVSLKVFDLLGREIMTLKNEYQTAGKYSVQFNGSNLASGIYFYVLVTNNFVESRKMNILK